MQTYGTLSLFENNEHLIPQHFINTDLGQLYQGIPFDELAQKIPSPQGEQSGLGRKNLLTVKGGIGLMILKHYLGVSDQMLIDRLNTDWSMQYFCGLSLGTKIIRNKNLVSDWRSYLGKYADVRQMQGSFASYWKPFLESKHVGMSDATVYESYIRHPNDIVLLWQGCEFIYEAICVYCKQNKLRKPRIRFENKREAVMAYQRTRKKSRRRSGRLRKRLTNFLTKLMNRFKELQIELALNKDQQRLKNIRTLLYQQQQRLLHPDQKIEHRIVSLCKPYVRPIVRGKETKSVEFGAKVNLLQVDGINFIEHLSYDAFNEGTRMISSIRLHRELFGACTSLPEIKFMQQIKTESIAQNTKSPPVLFPKESKANTKNKRSNCAENWASKEPLCWREALAMKKIITSCKK